jgi:hypothetical protein
MAIEYLPGYAVKPELITTSGDVLFTNGYVSIHPNQKTCEAYGYTYDKATGTCRAYAFNENLGRNVINENNNIQGSRNQTETGTNNTYIMGEENIVRGVSRNNVIVGSNNQINYGVNNASILGNYGLAQRPGEAVIGGGGSTVGKSQSSTIHLSGRTEDAGSAAATSLYVNGDSSVTIIARDADAIATSFTGFEANVIGVRTGGSAAGSVNDRILLRATGLVYEKAPSQTVSTLGSSGTVTGWTAAVAFSGTNDMLFQVTGAANMEISWSCTLNLYEMKL